MSRVITPSQTVGPFFGFGLPWRLGPYAVPEGTPGAVRLVGCLRDGGGAPVPDGLVESWQASPAGVRGFARCPTDAAGRYEILTLKPAALRDARGVVHAPHVLLSVFARGLLRRLVTRLYFPDEPAANDADPVLSAITDRAALATLIARAVDGGYALDIRLQGEGETVFFDV